MKRFLALALAMLLAFTTLFLVACNGSDESSAPEKSATESGEKSQEPDDGKKEDYKVAMITDYGDITDKSFNQTTYEACKAFCEENIRPLVEAEERSLKRLSPEERELLVRLNEKQCDYFEEEIRSMTCAPKKEN